MAGKSVENAFDVKKGLFVHRGVANGETRYDVPTDIFVPKYCCLTESDMDISVSGGKVEVQEFRHWFTEKYWHEDSSVEQRVEIQFLRENKSRWRSRGIPFL